MMNNDYIEIEEIARQYIDLLNIRWDGGYMKQFLQEVRH
ncbi:hypothetical protein AN619_20420 [Thermotalea metallivorans]|uniref:Uncharacterized protein n=1 Tax=Thermotalea metallivorans TaxID=520762 RepID=A0A140L2U7_9FIRM|nr:hypothetical protein AN619_20420 [Thermotalea metallivorans]